MKVEAGIDGQREDAGFDSRKVHAKGLGLLFRLARRIERIVFVALFRVGRRRERPLLLCRVVARIAAPEARESSKGKAGYGWAHDAA